MAATDGTLGESLIEAARETKKKVSGNGRPGTSLIVDIARTGWLPPRFSMKKEEKRYSAGQ